MKVIPYGKQSITEQDLAAVENVLRSDFLTQGPYVDKFEQVFSEFVGCKYSVAVTNGTAALHLAVMALGLNPGDKVLCTTNSFVASANCVLYCGGEIEFVDIDPNNFCMSLDALSTKLVTSPKGTYKGVIAVDFAGFPLNFESLKKIANDHDLWIIEDACHALGGSFVDSSGSVQKCGNGNFADISVFSFHPVKHVATGEGGMITTNDKKLYEKLKQLRIHGITKNPTEMNKVDGGWYYEMQSLGYNYRISDILCALGVSQLSRIEENLGKRREIAEAYRAAFGDLGILPPKLSKDESHAYHLFVILSSKRRELYDFLREKGIYTQVHYIPIHTQPYYIQKYGVQSFPVSEKYYSECLSLPMYHSMNDDEVGSVINAVRGFYSK